ncbi:MAG TPA: BTAD domain-containing putative transcriptional regulator [Trueperaceae bacterium]|nr:BTAD domain-containing putative transcriptional regulator [Trueperaceae bacterium]
MARLGVEATSLHVDRVRVLSSLPDTAPYVVTLEAPAGFGKTDLAVSWATKLSADGWRTLHVSQRGRDLRTAIAAALGAPADLDWGVLEADLWRLPTLLVIDDLEQGACADQLELLLGGVEGLLLLASRRPLASAGLVTAALRGRLMTLGPDDLVFDDDDAAGLFVDPVEAAAVLADAGGWPLLVAYAASTGLPLAAGAVSAAMRSGLSDGAWQRLLLQAAVPDAARELEHEQVTSAGAGRDAVAELEATGFVEVIDDTPRLAPAVRRALLGSRVAEVRQAVTRSAGMLSERQLCAAHVATGDYASLAATLDAATSALERDDPRSLLKWHALAPATPGGSRRIRVGNALCTVGRRGEGIELLIATAHDESLDADLRLTALGDAIYFLAEVPQDRDSARELLHGSASLVAAATPERQGRFLSTASAIDFRAGDYTAAKRLVERALAVLPRGSKHRYAPLINLAVLDWNLSGDIEGRVRLQHEGLEICREEYPEHVVGVCRDLAQLSLYLGREAEARAYLAEALRFGVSRPVLALEIEAMQAQLDGDLDELSDVMTRAAGVSDHSVVDAIASRYVTALCSDGQAHVALRRMTTRRPAGAFSAVAMALAHLAVGERDTAKSALAAVEDPHAEREFRLVWLAAKYRIGGEPADLESLCTMTSAGAGLLPHFVPFGELPADRPDLAVHYPLAVVMRSGWREAAAHRLPEVPPLRVTALGAMSVELLGESFEIVGKQRDLLALLLLGLGRRELGAELWPEAEPGKVRNNLNVQLNLLRRSLEPWGLKTYLHEDGMHRTGSDLHDLRAALAAGKVDEVVRLYRGPFAPGAGAEAVVEARIVLEREVTDALLEAAANAPPKRGEEYLKRLLEIEPLNEEALQRLLVVLVSSGRHGEATRRYRRFAADLHAQLGMEPSPATTRIVLERG